MPLFGSKKDKHKDEVVDDVAAGSHRHSSSHHSDVADPTNAASKEFKYERVETIAVDHDGHAELKDVREDRGAEDPGMNFKDKRPPALVPGNREGYVPVVSELDTVSTHSTASGSSMNEHIRKADSYAPSALATEKHVVREKTSDYSPTTASLHSGSGLRRADADTVSISSNASTISHQSNRSAQVAAVRQGAPALQRDVDNLETQVDRLAESGFGQNQPARGQFREDMDYNRSAGSQGDYNRTTQVTTGAPQVDYNRTVQVTNERPRVNQHIVHEKTEVIRETREVQPAQYDYVTVPVQRMEAGRMEHIRSGYTDTQLKDMVIPGPLMAPPIQSVTHDLLAQGTGGASTEIHATTNANLLGDIDASSLAPEEYERYRHRVEDLARQHEADATAKADQYRGQVEQDAELIRRTLERQHIRDIEFRKDMVESAVDRQQHEIQLEAEYAMRALELEREAARRALDQAKSQTNIDVRVDSAIGTTISKGSVSTQSEHQVHEQTLPHNATRL